MTPSAPGAGDTCSLRLPVPPTTAINCLQPELQRPYKNVDKAEDSVPSPGRDRGTSSQCRSSTKPCLKNCPGSPGKAEKPDTPMKELDPSTLFFQQFYFEISCSAKYMLYFLNIHEYINIFPSCPCLTRCHLLTTTIYYSLWFSISDNISLHFWLFNTIGIFLPSKRKKIQNILPLSLEAVSGRALCRPSSS